MRSITSKISIVAAGLALGFGPVFLGSSLPLQFNGGIAHAQDEESERETKKTPAMREKVYKRLAEAQEQVEANQNAEALKTLNELTRMSDLNSYELAQMHNFFGFIYFNQENYREAVRSYEQVLAQPNLPEAMQVGTMYSIAQLYFAIENYPKAVEALQNWFRVAKNPGPDPYILLGQGLYQMKKYREAITPIQKGMEMARERDKEIKENWYLILRVIYFELGENQKVADILEVLVRKWPKKEYWTQLSGMYGELGRNRDQTIVYELAYLQGMLDSGREIVTMAQLLLQTEVPYRAAVILEKGINDGLVERNAKNYRLLSQAWSLAQEDAKAIPALVEAARLSGDGELDIRLAQSYINIDQWDKAIEAARAGLAKGGLRREDQAQTLLGMALYNVERFVEARRAFESASTDSRSRKVSVQWMEHIEKEQSRIKQLAEARARR